MFHFNFKRGESYGLLKQKSLILDHRVLFLSLM